LLLLDGVLFDLRVIMLYRNPVDAIHAAVLKDNVYPHKTLQYQSRVTEETLAYLNNAMMFIPCEHQMWIDYDCFIHDPSQYAAPLSALLDLPQAYFTHIAVPPHVNYKDKFPASESQLVQEFIASHSDIWPFFALRPTCTRRPDNTEGNEVIPRAAA
jgi:hypothetical protein